MKREVHIACDFTNPGDLAQRLGRRSEFHSGTGCDVDLYNAYTREHVQVRRKRLEHGQSFISVGSDHPGNLFEAVLGEVVYSLSQQGGGLTIRRSD